MESLPQEENDDHEEMMRQKKIEITKQINAQKSKTK